MQETRGPWSPGFSPIPWWARAQEAGQGGAGQWGRLGSTALVAMCGQGCQEGQAPSLGRQPYTMGLAALARAQHRGPLPGFPLGGGVELGMGNLGGTQTSQEKGVTGEAGALPQPLLASQLST